MRSAEPVAHAQKAGADLHQPGQQQDRTQRGHAMFLHKAKDDDRKTCQGRSPAWASRRAKSPVLTPDSYYLSLYEISEQIKNSPALPSHQTKGILILFCVIGADFHPLPPLVTSLLYQKCVHFIRSIVYAFIFCRRDDHGRIVPVLAIRAAKSSLVTVSQGSSVVRNGLTALWYPDDRSGSPPSTMPS